MTILTLTVETAACLICGQSIVRRTGRPWPYAVNVARQGMPDFRPVCSMACAEKHVAMIQAMGR